MTTIHSRVEDPRISKADYILSRAVAPLKDLWFWSKPILKKRPVDQPSSPSGLICLKGGDLAQEISDSGCRPKKVDIYQLFPEKYFEEKYLLNVPY